MVIRGVRGITVLGIVALSISGCGLFGNPSSTAEAPNATSADDLDGGAGYLTAVADLTSAGIPPGGRLQVFATTTIVGDVVAEVGGQAIDLTVLLPPGADPHSFTASPQDFARAYEDDLIFVNGFDLEETLDQDLAQAAEQVPIVSISEGVETVAFGDEGAEPNQTEGAESEEHHHGADPHVWFDPLRVAKWTDTAAAALGAIDPAHADLFQANAESYRGELESLDDWIIEHVSAIPPEKRLLVTDHDAFTYFAERYGFKIIGMVIPSYSTSASPSAKEFATLEDTIHEFQVPAIFIGITANRDLADNLARDTGVEVVVLYTGSLSDPNGPAGTYLDFMRTNVTAIVEALS